MVIEPGKPKRVSKSPWECKVGMGQECLRKESGPRMPKEEEMGRGSPSSMNVDPMTMLGHFNQVKEKHTASPKEAQQARVKIKPR